MRSFVCTLRLLVVFSILACLAGTGEGVVGEVCENEYDLVKAIPWSSITRSFHSQDDDNDKKDPHQINHLNNTLQRLYIDDKEGWHTYSENIYVGLNFGKKANITNIITRGIENHLGLAWIETYTVKYKSKEGDNWKSVMSGDSVRIFKANDDYSTSVTNPLVLTATSLRINAETTHRCCDTGLSDLIGAKLGDLGNSGGFAPSIFSSATPHFTGMRLGVTGCLEEAPTPKPVKDIVVLFDTSLSILEKSFDLLKSRILQQIKLFDIGESGDHIGLVTYNTQPKIIFDLNKYFDVSDVSDVIQKLKFSDNTGMTFTGRALKFVREELLTKEAGARENAHKTIMLATDGYHSDKIDTSDQRAALIAQNVNILEVSDESK